MVNDPLDHGMLRLDGAHHEVSPQPVRPRATRDVVDIEIGHGGGDFLALPIDDGVMDQGAVDGGHGGGLIAVAGAVPV
jgi:hypothetical protein